VLLRVAILLVILISLPSFAGEGPGSEKYVPLFEADVAFEPGTISEKYMKAYRSQNRETAIQEWEKFLVENVITEPPEFTDVTDLTLIRQAHYELVRLYYLVGRSADADKTLIKANDIVVFLAPEPEEGKKWCRIHGYCK